MGKVRAGFCRLMVQVVGRSIGRLCYECGYYGGDNNNIEQNK